MTSLLSKYTQKQTVTGIEISTFSFSVTHRRLSHLNVTPNIKGQRSSFYQYMYFVKNNYSTEMECLLQLIIQRRYMCLIRPLVL